MFSNELHVEQQRGHGWTWGWLLMLTPLHEKWHWVLSTFFHGEHPNFRTSYSFFHPQKHFVVLLNCSSIMLNQVNRMRINKGVMVWIGLASDVDTTAWKVTLSFKNIFPWWTLKFWEHHLEASFSCYRLFFSSAKPSELYAKQQGVVVWFRVDLTPQTWY